MEVVYIDSEPPGPAGGGIRTYLRLALGICRDAGVPAVVYTHNPDAYPGHEARPIGREPWLSRPWRGLAYRLAYGENVLWEHARWLRDELEAGHVPGRVYEFCDYQGYAYFALRSPYLRPHTVVRVHTPAYLTLPRPRGIREKISAALLAYRERDCLMGRARVTLPSAAFAAERLPWLKGGLHLPNPLPSAMGAPAARAPEASGTAGGGRVPAAVRFLYLGRIEARKGVLTLLAGFLRLAKQDPGVTLTVAGSDVQPYADKVRAHLSAAPEELAARITWTPPVPPEALPALFARHDALAVPSLWENSPYVYFEGMAAGLLCVGSATGEMREAAVEIGGGGGILAAPGDPEDWTRALTEAAAACRDPARRRESIASQSAYLEGRRAGIPDRMLACYRELAETP